MCGKVWASASLYLVIIALLYLQNGLAMNEAKLYIKL